MFGRGLNRSVRRLRRYRRIAAVFARFGLHDLADSVARRIRPRGRTIRDRAEGPEGGRPRRFRLALEELGPTFVKFGQLLATRPDIIGQAYVDELERLQDQVAPLDFAKIREVVETELQGPIDTHFADFDPHPLASASIAQVHRARTLDGRPVAVKVRRPSAVKTVEADCQILESLAGWIKNSLGPRETVDPVVLVREFTVAVQNELHFLQELRNQQRFERTFADDPTVHIPATMEELSADGVLTMEFIDGIKPSDERSLREAGLDPRVVAHRGVDFVLRQMFDFGTFHTDPHPGNFLVLPGNVLAPLDFGQVARLSGDDRRLLGELVQSIVNLDAPRLVEAFERGEMLSEATDVPHLTRQLGDMLEVYHDLPVKEIPFGRMMMHTFDVIRRNRVRPPATFTLMLKAMMIVETLARNLDSDFQLLDHLEPYARKLSMQRLEPSSVIGRTSKMLRDAADLASRLPDDLNMILRKLRRGQFQLHVQHEHLEQLIRTADKASNRVSFALIIAGLLVASSLLVPQPGSVLGLVSLQSLGVFGYVIAAMLGLWLLGGIIRSRHL